MAMQEIRVGERQLFAWDGQILEVWGALKASGSRRFHPAVSEMRIDAPDKKGRVNMSLNWHDAVTTVMTFEADEYARLRPILDEFAAAIAAASAS